MPITINGTGTVTGISAGGLPSGTVTSDTLASSAIYLTAPAGAVCFVAQNTAPTGWLKANGAAVSRTTYAALFGALGTTFGAGDGSTTFNLPDLRGEFPRGWDDSRGVDSGRSFGGFQSHEITAHGHSIFANSFAGDLQVVMGPVGGDGNKYGVSDSGTDASSNTAVLRAVNTGGSETRPRNIALLAIIKF